MRTRMNRPKGFEGGRLRVFDSIVAGYAGRRVYSTCSEGDSLRVSHVNKSQRSSWQHTSRHLRVDTVQHAHDLIVEFTLVRPDIKVHRLSHASTSTSPIGILTPPNQTLPSSPSGRFVTLGL